MMRLIKLLLTLSIIISLMSCIERREKKSNLDANLIESIDKPRVIRDTVIQVVILDTVDHRPAATVQPEALKQVVAQPTRSTSHSSTSNRNEKEDHYDGNNSGFFDNYRSNYHGDPNQGLTTTTIRREVDTNADEIERKKAAIAKSLDILEKENHQNQVEQEQQERERQARNERVIQEAKEQAKAQQNKQKQTPRGKTLDTNALYD